MNKVAVVFWSGTGNTEAMADAVVAGAIKAGASVDKYNIGSFSPENIKDYDSLAFGCPAMGAEMLEDLEFEPVFSDCLPKLVGKKVALFGSYGWGNGQWMRDWEDICRSSGVDFSHDSVICEGAPDAVAEASCSALGSALA